MNPARSVRRLEEKDLPELVELCREHAAFEQAPWVEKERLAGLRDLFLTSDDSRCWVLDAPDELAGFASASLELATWDAQRYLHLDCLYLREAYRGQGLGLALVERVAQAALEMGAVNLQWQTPEWNDGAERFYRRLGAVPQRKLRFTLSLHGCAQLLGSKPNIQAPTPSEPVSRSLSEGP
ncbi:MAG: GNAT family N-acetyltransferase [Deltaproteobacteria bacterium]|nr:GNAT family N-acetyltransferase [Deltaproteobacteria bacterium]